MSFEDVQRANGTSRSFLQAFDDDGNGDDDLDDYFHHPEKKRRLRVDQVKFLEKTFEVDNKLEPERKIQLAKDLGLQPRQVAIWFQNRRARWKTKQLEKDYDALQASYNSLKTDYDNLLNETDKLKSEVLQLEEKLLLKNKEKGDSNSDVSEPPEKLIAHESTTSEVKAVISSSDAPTKSDIFDSSSPPHYTDGIHSAIILEAGDSSFAFEQEQSDLSQDEEDNILHHHPYIFPKVEYDDFSDPPAANSCNLGFPVEEDNAIWSWAYWKLVT